MSTPAIVPNRKPRPDFIDVRLSAAGLTFAGNGATLRIATAHMHYLFVDAGSVEVLRAGEWPQLQRYGDAEGKALFEEATDVPAPVPPAPAAEVSPAPQAVVDVPDATPTEDSQNTQTAPVKAAARKSEVNPDGQ